MCAFDAELNSDVVVFGKIAQEVHYFGIYAVGACADDNSIYGRVIKCFGIKLFEEFNWSVSICTRLKISDVVVGKATTLGVKGYARVYLCCDAFLFSTVGW